MLSLLVLPGCKNSATSSGDTSQKGNDLDQMQTARIRVSDHEFEVWLAQTNDQRQKGLMFVTQEQMQPLEDGTERGMLFLFSGELDLNFWMKDTLISLDIAYADRAGRIVKIHHETTPLDTSLYPSSQPAQFVLEVSAGVLGRLGIAEGDVMVFPE